MHYFRSARPKYKGLEFSKVKKCTKIRVIRSSLLQLNQRRTWFLIVGFRRRGDHKETAETKVQLNSDYEHGPEQDRQTVVPDRGGKEAFGDEAEHLQPETVWHDKVFERNHKILYQQKEGDHPRENAGEKSQRGQTAEIGPKVNSRTVLFGVWGKKHSSQTAQRVSGQQRVQRAERADWRRDQNKVRLIKFDFSIIFFTI